jgi:hypothetical protein
MDVERLGQYVLRCPLQELEFRHESDVYVLGNSLTKPAWWDVMYARYEATGLVVLGQYKRRGLNNTLSLIEQFYPDFYSWLVLTFPK